MEATIAWGQKLLVVGGMLSILASLLHIGAIIGGPDWYRFFGAGEEMALMAERGELYPAIVTTGIALVLAVWAYFAFAGAGRVSKPPLLRTGLVVISGIYLMRGLIIVPIILLTSWQLGPFEYWSSAIVLVYGLFYAIGTWKAWPSLSSQNFS